MDGSNYRPHHEEPHDHQVEEDDDHPLILLIFLLAVTAGMLFFTYRHQTLNFAHCLMGNAEACAAIQGRI